MINFNTSHKITAQSATGRSSASPSAASQSTANQSTRVAGHGNVQQASFRQTANAKTIDDSNVNIDRVNFRARPDTSTNSVNFSRTPKIIQVSQEGIQINDFDRRKSVNLNQPGYHAPQDQYQLNSELLRREELNSLVGLSVLA